MAGGRADVRTLSMLLVSSLTRLEAMVEQVAKRPSAEIKGFEPVSMRLIAPAAFSSAL